MNLPVLFRTIDGTSQVTIETQYADRRLQCPVGMARRRRLRFSFFKRQGPRFVSLGCRLRTVGRVRRVVQPLWARSSVG